MDTKKENTEITNEGMLLKTEPEESIKNTEAEFQKDDFNIVGIGASAGGFDAFRSFFSSMPADSGMAFIIVSHMSSDHKSLLCDLLRNFTQIPLFEAQDGMKVEADCIYVIPPGKDMAIMHRTLQLFEPVTSHGIKHPIDFFFRSLSKDVGEKAVGIVLSGTGMEGTQGIRDIKGEGGLVIVQSPESAKFEFMPASAIATELVDYVLPPDEMAECLIKYKKQKKYLFNNLSGADSESSRSSIRKLLTLLRDKTGNDFSLYKQNTVIRRIERRMSLHQMSGISDYIKFLSTNQEETERLNKEFLINVTSFFRDPEVFDFLKSVVFPECLKKHIGEDIFRVWIPGCSTGEEAYSMAIIIREYLNANHLNIPFKVFATDLDEDSVEKARKGVYPESIAVDVSESRLKAFFKKTDVTYTVKEDIRNSLVFARHNLIKDPPFSRMDLISCRNLMIYLGVEAQRHVIPLFHYALNPEGILVLGTSESISGFFDLFTLIDKKQRIYKMKSKDKHFAINVSFTENANMIYKENIANLQPVSMINKMNLKNELEYYILDNYSPPCLVIDGNGNILYLYGKTGKFLEPSSGKASLNVFDMARKDIRREIKIAVKNVLTQKREVKIENLPVNINKNTQYVDIIVHPLFLQQHFQNLLIIIFKEVPETHISEVDRTQYPAKLEIDDYYIKLEQELKLTRENLQNTIEDLDISNEELKSANEELQSINEELQSTNEELEISREELQSINEELVTLNSELRGKVDELTEVSSDMENLLASTDIATVFLDNSLCIKRFTPATTKILRLISTDVGRPFNDINSSLIYEEQMEDITGVLVTLTAKTRELRDKSGSYYLMKMLPYRTINNVIDGVVIVFMDISTTKKLEEERKEFESRYESLFNSAYNGIVLIDKESCKIVGCNKEFQRQTSRDARLLKTMRLQDLIFFKDRGTFDNELCSLNENKIIEIEFSKPDSSKIQLELKIISPKSEISPYIQCITREISQDRQIRESLREAHELSSTIFEFSGDPLLVLDDQLKITSANRAYYNIFKSSPEETIDHYLFGVADDRLHISDFKKHMEDIISSGEPLKDYHIELNVPDSGKMSFMAEASPLIKSENRFEKIILSLKKTS